MPTFSERLCEALIERRISAAELSRKINVDEGTISNYKKGKYVPKQPRLDKISQALNVSIPWLMGADVPMELRVDNIIHINKVRKIPVLGVIACGSPIWAEENFEDMILLPDGIQADFALICKGDSMINARIFDGDIVYIKKQPTVENGEIAAVLIENEATLKRVYFDEENKVLQLVPENNEYSPLVYCGEKLQEVYILGKAVAFLSSVK